MLDPKRPRVLVALGGKSTEREVSISTGREVAESLEKTGYQTDIIDFGTGRFLQLPELDTLEKDAQKLPKVVNYPLTDIARHFEVVFIAMHGRFGENGVIQGILDEIGIKYTGSGALASAMAMDKRVSKVYLKENNLSTPEFQIIENSNEPLKLKFPVVTKPVDQGSSVGVSICENEAEYKIGLKQALSYGSPAIVEAYIRGTEITVPILDDDKGVPRALPVVEIVPKTKFFDYKAKYGGTTEEIVPARISQSLAKQAHENALKFYTSLGCRHFSRIDMIIDKNNKIQVLELNSIPGLTSESLFPKAARAAGYDFNRLIDHLIKIALR